MPIARGEDQVVESSLFFPAKDDAIALPGRSRRLRSDAASETLPHATASRRSQLAAFTEMAEA